MQPAMSDDDLLDMVFDPNAGMSGQKRAVPEADAKAPELDAALAVELKAMQIQAISHAESGRVDEAIAVFGQCIARCPTYAPAYNDRAMAYQLKHAIAKAKAAAATAGAAATAATAGAPKASADKPADGKAAADAKAAAAAAKSDAAEAAAEVAAFATASTAAVQKPKADAAAAPGDAVALLALADLDQAIALGAGQPVVLKHAYTQRGIVRKLLRREEAALADFERAATLGSEYARQESVRLNPYAKMCNAMLQQAFEQMKPLPKALAPAPAPGATAGATAGAACASAAPACAADAAPTPKTDA